MGFDYASFVTIHPLAGGGQGFANYPDAWQAHYLEQGLGALDPTLALGARSTGVLDWRRMEPHAHYRRVFRDAADFGITEQGLSIPVRGALGDLGLLSVTKACSGLRWDDIVARRVGDLQTVAGLIHEITGQSDSLGPEPRRTPLSSLERDLLRWVARGKAPTAIASILAISVRTVNLHLRSCCHKLQARQPCEAAGKALAMGALA